MRIDHLIDATFVKRLNRFAAVVRMDGRDCACHVPNSGRLAELLVEGAPARVLPFRGGGRTECGLVMVQNRGCWVVIDAHRANAVALEAVQAGLVPGLKDARDLRREVTVGDSRFDMACIAEGRLTYIEVKCSTLSVDGVGLFPDAPTERGCKHLKGLAELSRQGFGAHVLFVLQHPASRSFAPNRATDPQFADRLSEAAAAGVCVHALRCQSDENGIRVTDAVAYCNNL